MKKRFIIALTLLLVCITTSVFACTGDSQNTNQNTSLAPNWFDNPDEATASDIAGILPSSATSCTFMHLGPFLDELTSEDMEHQLGNEFIAGAERQEELSGIDFWDTEWYVELTLDSYNEKAVIIAGDLDMGNIRSALQKTGSQEEPYKGTEVWYVEGDLWNSEYGVVVLHDKEGSVALKNNVAIFGETNTVIAIIDVFSGSASSMYNNTYYKEIFDRLPDGGMIYVEEGFSMLFSSMDNAVASGTSTAATDPSTTTMTWIIQFTDEQSATDSIEDIRDYMEWLISMSAEEYNIDQSEVQITQDDEFLIAEISLSIPYSPF